MRDQVDRRISGLLVTRCRVPQRHPYDYDHHSCFSQILAHAREFPGHAYADLRGLTQALDDAEPTA